MALAKIRVKVGGIEIEYEGEASFLEKDLITIVQELQKIAPMAASSSQVQGIPLAGANGQFAAGAMSLTTKSIAAKLNAKSGSELAEAAVAHLGIIKGLGSFKRSEINDAMKSAIGIYKVSMTSNLTPIIKTLLTENTLVETGAETYALTPDAEKKLKERLGIG